MRRQVKPFVTEYRGTPRRTKDLGAEPETPRHRAYDEAQRFFQSEPNLPVSASAVSAAPDYGPPDDGDDSYDAALRAADALFSAPAKPVFREVPASEPVSSQPWPQPSQIQREDRPASSLFDDLALEKVANSPPRRILQAIEPAAEDRFAALEAERAPKRRGRKPGSKNKPKIPLSDDWPSAAAASAPQVSVPKLSVPNLPGPKLPGRKPAAPPTVLEPVASFANDDLADDDLADDPFEGVPDRDLTNDVTPGTPSKSRNDRFMRKRDGLRPGERWKRRLPKAAW